LAGHAGPIFGQNKFRYQYLGTKECRIQAEKSIFKPGFPRSVSLYGQKAQLK
jgi:hypothetical protein